VLSFTLLEPFILNFDHLLAGFTSSIPVQQNSALLKQNKTFKDLLPGCSGDQGVMYM